jgi:hypothetical protein
MIQRNNCDECCVSKFVARGAVESVYFKGNNAINKHPTSRRQYRKCEMLFVDHWTRTSPDDGKATLHDAADDTGRKRHSGVISLCRIGVWHGTAD